MKPIKDFQPVDFNNINYNNYQDLCDFYNDGIVSDEIYEELTNPADIKPETLLKNAAAAFEDVEDNRKRVQEKSFGDFLNF